MTIDYPDFITHKRYLKFISKISNNLEFTYKSEIVPDKTLSKNKKAVKQRLLLIDLSFHNLVQENKVVRSKPDYARAFLPWMAIKNYYLVFYLNTLFMYVLTGREDSFYAKHSDIRKFLPNLINENKVVSSSQYFNKVLNNSEVEKFTNPIYTNLQILASDEMRYKGLMKKIYEYQKDDYKIQNKIIRLAGHKKAKFNNKKTSLFDFFYWYRVKSNYRDMDFIADHRIPAKSIEDFYNDYFLAAYNVSEAVIRLTNQIYKSKTGGNTPLIG